MFNIGAATESFHCHILYPLIFFFKALVTEFVKVLINGTMAKFNNNSEVEKIGDNHDGLS